MKSASYKADRRSIVGSYIDADCLLKNTSAKQNIYVDNEKLQHLDEISFR